MKEEPPPPPPPRARAAGRGRSRSPCSRSEETKRRGAPSAPRARRSCRPARPPRAALATPGAAERCGRGSRLRRRPPQAPRGPLAGLARAARGIAWVGCPRASGLLSPASLNPLRAANSIKIKTRGRLKKNQNKDENIHLKITSLPEREMFEHVMSNV